MEWSKYNYLFKSDKYGHLLFNAETNAFAKIDEDTFDTLKLVSENKENIKDLDEDFINELKRAEILVSDPTQFIYKKRLQYYFNTFESSNLGLAIAPTTHCNFNCPYCYEENKKPIYMNQKTEANIIAFIKNHDRIKNYQILWYGGEPLLGFDSIKHAKLSNHSLITNGYLLDENKSIFFKDYPLDGVQITIDGTKEFHDKRRTLALNNGPTFDRIVENIDKFVFHNPKTKVVIRVN